MNDINPLAKLELETVGLRYRGADYDLLPTLS